MSKALVSVLALMLVLIGYGAFATAAQNVANVSQKGSLLIFPKIDTSPVGTNSYDETVFHDTIVTIGNDNTQEVWLKCFWVNQDQLTADFMFRITPNQPIWFRASDGLGTGWFDDTPSVHPINVPPFFPGDNATGELKCWAVDAGDQTQVVFNHLYGSAFVFDPIHNAAYQYNAWSFYARNAGTPGTLVLDGANYYDACPQYLLFNFFSKGSELAFPNSGGNAAFINSDLTLVPCHQDLRQDRTPTCTKAKFDIWNENEVKYTGAYQCLKCWFEGYLDDIGTKTQGGYGGLKFTYRNLHTMAGRFRVQGVASTVCQNVFTTVGTDGKLVDKCWTNSADTTYHGQVATPLLGLMSTEISFSSGLGLEAMTATTPNTAGAWGPPLDSGKYPVPQILWDHDDPPPEAPSTR